MNENAEINRIVEFYDDNGYFNNPTEEAAYKLYIENKSLRNDRDQWRISSEAGRLDIQPMLRKRIEALEIELEAHKTFSNRVKRDYTECDKLFIHISELNRLEALR